MEHLGWTTARAVYVEANPKVSLGLGALGVLLALVGVLMGAPQERSASLDDADAIERTSSLDVGKHGAQASR